MTEAELREIEGRRIRVANPLEAVVARHEMFGSADLARLVDRDVSALVAEVRRLKREAMLNRLELRHYQEFMEFNPDAATMFRLYEERLRTPQMNHIASGDETARRRERERKL